MAAALSNPKIKENPLFILLRSYYLMLTMQVFNSIKNYLPTTNCRKCISPLIMISTG
jgi:hypothetical protein